MNISELSTLVHTSKDSYKQGEINKLTEGEGERVKSDSRHAQACMQMQESFKTSVFVLTQSLRSQETPCSVCLKLVPAHCVTVLTPHASVCVCVCLRKAHTG